ncbi:hypothetical protein Y032_0012g1709 [Ancylostoma ceylanicum]|uniref:Uncharacterized protein n=1 Tax=Ancylostoma ceylanicum TaxID=53326 RepID=A0A016VBU9_9BILA|nr:hypothetical protein Y032_0012g1709 [Ancylostoma ceylanicum]
MDANWAEEKTPHVPFDYEDSISFFGAHGKHLHRTERFTLNAWKLHFNKKTSSCFVHIHLYAAAVQSNDILDPEHIRFSGCL